MAHIVVVYWVALLLAHIMLNCNIHVHRRSLRKKRMNMRQKFYDHLLAIFASMEHIEWWTNYRCWWWIFYEDAIDTCASPPPQLSSHHDDCWCAVVVGPGGCCLVSRQHQWRQHHSVVSDQHLHNYIYLNILKMDILKSTPKKSFFNFPLSLVSLWDLFCREIINLYVKLGSLSRSESLISEGRDLKSLKKGPEMTT